MQKPAKPRKPQINLEATAEEKALIERVATARGMKAATLLRTLALDEARRLGLPYCTQKSPAGWLVLTHILGHPTQRVATGLLPS